LTNLSTGSCSGGGGGGQGGPDTHSGKQAVCQGLDCRPVRHMHHPQAVFNLSTGNCSSSINLSRRRSAMDTASSGHPCVSPCSLNTSKQFQLDNCSGAKQVGTVHSVFEAVSWGLCFRLSYRARFVQLDGCSGMLSVLVMQTRSVSGCRFRPEVTYHQ
jgi:hypothetical protein